MAAVTQSAETIYLPPNEPKHAEFVNVIPTFKKAKSLSTS
jgi:hypothetical protein